MTTKALGILLTAILLQPFGAGLAAQGTDSRAALRQALPAVVADRVLQRIADAEAQGLPPAPLVQRALELAAKGVPPGRIEQAVSDRQARLIVARQALVAGGRPQPTGDELDAAATAMGKGVDGNAVSEVAKSARSGRSLAVPLFVIASLVDRGLPSDQALARVLARLEARASDRQLEGMGESPGGGTEPATKLTGLDLAATKRPIDVGRPALVPANAGKTRRPTEPGVPPSSKPSPRSGKVLQTPHAPEW